MTRRYTIAQGHYAFADRGDRARAARNVRMILTEVKGIRRNRLMLGHALKAVEQGIAKF